LLLANAARAIVRKEQDLISSHLILLVGWHPSASQIFFKEEKKEPISVSFATLQTTSRFKTIIVSRAFSSNALTLLGVKSFILQVVVFMIIGLNLYAVNLPVIWI
jgi:hypothetical protein